MRGSFGKGAAHPVINRLVPGDIIDVEAGDHVPADARLIHAAAFLTQEAALTGNPPRLKNPAGR